LKKIYPAFLGPAQDIALVQLSTSKVFALSTTGKVYVLSSDSAKQKLASGRPTTANSSWWGLNWLWGAEQTVDFAEVKPNVPLSWGERYGK
jgi:hypothetical protein